MTQRPGFINNMKISYAGVLVDPGRRIRICRTNNQLTQAELAEKAGISSGYLSSLELNKREAPTSVYTKIANAMNMTLDQLWGF